MRVLLLGGTGLISTRITEQLSARGEDVWHLNRGQRAAGFGGRPVSPNVRTLIADRTHYAAFEATMQVQQPFDVVIDMVAYSPADAESAVRAFAGRCAQYIFCSTVDVYAHPHPTGKLPYQDNAPRSGLNDYARGKVRCEEILEAAHTRGALNVTILRPAATYAEGAGVLDSLRGRATYIDRLRKARPIIVHGDGQSLWCSCHADDVARAFVGACGNATSFGKSYHVTGEEFLTWNQHHESVARAIGAPAPRLVHIPTDVLAGLLPSETLTDAAHWTFTNFQFNNIFDNSAARRDLGFRYTVHWETGAARLVAWLDAHNAIANSDLDHFDDSLIAAWEAMRSNLAASWTRPTLVRPAEKKRRAASTARSTPKSTKKR